MVPTMNSSSETPTVLNCSHNCGWKMWSVTVLLKLVGQVRIGRLTGEHAGHDGAGHAADGVNAEGVQRVVMPSQPLTL